MIIQCKNCEKKFRLDESLLDKDGSRVRCSVCRQVFVAYPPEPILLEEVAPLAHAANELDRTFSEDSRPFRDKAVTKAALKDREVDFDDVFNEFPDVKEIEGDEISGLRRRGRSRFMLFFLMILFVLTGSVAAIVYWAPELIPSNLPFLKPAGKKAAPDPGTRRLSFEDVNGGFVVSQKSGKLYVVRGMVINNYPKTRSFIRVKCAILDDDGRSAKMKVAYAGNTFNDEKLKSLPMEEIDSAMEKRYGMNRNNFNIAPGSRIPFMIVFKELPENLSEFEVVAVSSSPGA